MRPVDLPAPPTLSVGIFSRATVNPVSVAADGSSLQVKVPTNATTGMVRIGDELWSATSDAALETGAEVEGSGELVGIRPFDFRQLFIEWDTGYGILRAGLVAVPYWGAEVRDRIWRPSTTVSFAVVLDSPVVMAEYGALAALDSPDAWLSEQELSRNRMLRLRSLP